jgi:hypothetical protein
MTRINRNIVTSADAARMSESTNPSDLPRTFGSHPPFAITSSVLPARVMVAATGVGAPPGAVAVPTEDDYLTRLLKYVPLEVLGAYLFLASIVESNVTNPHLRGIWLAGLLGGIVLLSVPYNIRVLGVVRPTQIIVSAIGLVTYVFSIGGWFATTTWYHMWYASFALTAFGLVVAMIKLRPLPPEA